MNKQNNDTWTINSVSAYCVNTIGKPEYVRVFILVALACAIGLIQGAYMEGGETAIAAAIDV